MMALDFGRYLLTDEPQEGIPQTGYLNNFVLESYRRQRGHRSPAGSTSPRSSRRAGRSPEIDRRGTKNNGRGRKKEKDSYNTTMKACSLVSIDARPKSDSCISRTRDRRRAAKVQKRNVSFADENGHDLATYCWIPTRENDNFSYFDIFDDDFEEDFGVPSFSDSLFSFSSRYSSSPLSSPPSSPGTSSDDDGDYFTTLNWAPPILPRTTEKKVELDNNVVCSLCFEQPGSKFDEFLKTLDENFICLENVRVEDVTVFCSVKVKNLGYQKNVKARCSYDGWISYFDIQATHVPSGCQNPVNDTFSFAVYSPPSSTLSRKGPRTAELALCYQVNGEEHWDNNKGSNYRIVWSSPSS